MTSVTPALSIATSVPVPIAMPTFACASAGASLMPSPAIATTRPRSCNDLMASTFCVGQHLGDDFLDAELPADGLRRFARIAGQHDHAHTLGA